MHNFMQKCRTIEPSDYQYAPLKGKETRDCKIGVFLFENLLYSWAKICRNDDQRSVYQVNKDHEPQGRGSCAWM